MYQNTQVIMVNVSYPTNTSTVQWYQRGIVSHVSKYTSKHGNVSYPTNTSTVQWHQRGIASHVSKYPSRHGKCPAIQQRPLLSNGIKGALRVMY
jgi:hypothetical protein